MNDIPLPLLCAALVILVAISAFFSGSETAAMAINRYRLRHLARGGNRRAKRMQSLLQRTDRLLGVVLIGNTFANILASAVATIIAGRLFGDLGIAIGTLLLTLLVLVFAEVTPKTIAALRPERFAFATSWTLSVLLRFFYPFVWLVNLLAGGLLYLIGIKERSKSDMLSHEELRSVVNAETMGMPAHHRQMLLSVLDLREVRVDEAMTPRQDILGIDLEEDLGRIVHLLETSPHNFLPLYREDINYIIGILPIQKALYLSAKNKLSKEQLEAIATPAYFVPEGAPLYTQLINFQRHDQTLGLVVDEYGDIVGLITLHQILEEIVRDFSIDSTTHQHLLRREKEHCYRADGAINVREINKLLNLELPTDGPVTLNGLITEELEDIPTPDTGLLIARYPIEILEVRDKAVKSARIYTEPVKSSWNVS